MNLVFVTGNMDKVQWVNHFLGIELEHQKLDLPEVQDLDPHVVIEAKAKAAYEIIGKPVLVEDTSIVFPAMGRLPGPLIKFFMSELGNEGICQLINTYADRSAYAHIVFGLYDGKNFYAFEGKKQGSISTEPRGGFGHGWDAIFIPKGQPKTCGEMTLDEYEAHSARRLAVEKLRQFLEA